MKEEDLGITKNGHVRQMTALENHCLECLADRVGAEQRISQHALALRVGVSKRDLRRLLNHLIISHEIPIMCRAGNGGGHYFPASEGEVAQFYEEFHKRAMTGLMKASRGKKSAFVELVAQLSFGFDGQEAKEAIEALKLTPDSDPVPAFVGVVTRCLDRISAEPQRYAAEIRKLQQTYGDIFVPRDKLRMLREKASEFQWLLQEIS